MFSTRASGSNPNSLRNSALSQERIWSTRTSLSDSSPHVPRGMRTRKGNASPEVSLAVRGRTTVLPVHLDQLVHIVAVGIHRRAPFGIVIPIMEPIGSSEGLVPVDFQDNVKYIGKPRALPGDSKSLTAPYFETLRNAEKALTHADLFGGGRRAKAR